jgi:hypothetical protein
MDKTTVQDALTHLSALGFVEGDTVYFNCLKPQMKFDFIYPDISIASITKAESLGRNIFFCPQRKGDYLSENIKECQVLFYEHDTVDKDLSAKMWKAIGLPPPTIQIDTGNKSIHTYYVLNEPISVELFTEAQKHLIRHFNSDAALSNPNRLMRLAGCIHPKTNTVSTIYSHNGFTYSIDELLPKLRQGEVKKPRKNAKTSLEKVDSEKLAEIREALNAINSPKYLDEEPGWASVGMALRATSESLYQDFVNWSLRSSNSEVCDFAYRWSHWKPEGYTGGKTYKTIFEYAYECGWKSSNPKYQPSDNGKFDHLDKPAVVDNPFSRAVDEILQHYGNSIRYNTLTNKHEYLGQKKSINELIGAIKTSSNISLPRWDAPLIVDYAAKQNSYNPIVEYLDSCKPKDGVSHNNVASKYWNGTAEEDEYVSLFLRAAVLRQTNKNTFVDFPFVLILIGDSGCGKTATFEILFSSYIHSMTGFSTEGNTALTKSWLCFWDEMVIVLDPKNRDKINEFTSKKWLSYNVMYVSKDEQKPVPFVIGGTTTDYQFLSDTYSQRRWMVCEIPRGTKIKLQQMQEDVDAIWASAYQAVKGQESLGSFTKLIEANTAKNKQYINQSSYHQIVLQSIEPYQQMYGYDFVHINTFIEFIWRGKQGLPPKDLPSEIKSILTNLEYKSEPYKRIPFRDQRVWYPKSHYTKV